MAPALKRKRTSAAADALTNGTPIAVLEESPAAATESAFDKAWEVAGKPSKELVPVNGTNGYFTDEETTTTRPDNVHSIIRKSQTRKGSSHVHERIEQSWKASQSIGGRLIEIDPVFTTDEKFLIVAQKRTILSYSTSTSLLHRSLSLPSLQQEGSRAYIISYVLSPTDSNILYVAQSNGEIYKLDWTTGVGVDKAWVTSLKKTTHMMIASLDAPEGKRDIIFTVGSIENKCQILVHELSELGESTTVKSKVIYSTPYPISNVQASSDGAVIVATAGARILVGSLRGQELVRYEFRIFESSDVLSSMDFRVSKRAPETGKKGPSRLDRYPVVDVVVGNVKGVIFLHDDLLGNLVRSETPSAEGPNPLSLAPRKHHWHRKAVLSVKWSLDGNYIISGGSETVIVIWQLDTGRQQLLPNLSATIQNIVVSPTGASYAVHLADNSTMVLSTAELKPTANISGIQAHVVGTGLEIDDGVDRVGREVRDNLVLPRINAIVNPANPSRMHLAVSEGQELDPKLERTYGTPFLQTFDLGYNVSVSRQALTRTNVTHKNIAPSGRRINEPLVSHMQISTDGTWLATVDEWLPPKQDFEFLGYSGRTAEEERRRHREVFIKFWQWDAKEDTWALVSRIDTPHTLASENNGAGRVLDLVSSPTSHTFATLGEDSVVQLWTSKVRKRDGVVVRGQDGEPLRTWHCSQRMTIRNAEDSNLSQSLTHGSLSFSSDGSILAASISSPHDTSSLVHILDPTTGFIRTTYSTLSHGPITHLAILHKYLIVLSDLLTVYDLVLDTPVSSIPLFPSPPAPQLTRDQKTEMVHLAIDPSAGPTGVFAIAVPRNVDSTIRGAFSEIAVFDPRNPSEAVFGMEWPSLITALVPAVGTPGFVVVDADAEVRSVSPKASQTVVAAARPMAELGLDAAASALEEESAAGGLDVALLPDEGEAEDRDVEMVDDDGQEGDEFEKIAREAGVDGLDDDDDSGVRVFSQQALADALGVGRPSWALPPVEEMFYRVVDLVSGPRAVKA